MEKKHTLMSKIILLISIIGLSGGVLVRISYSLYIALRDEIPNNWIFFGFFIFFALICLFGMILYALTRKSSKEDKLRRYAFLISGIGLFLNGLWIMVGIIASSY